ncbi:MAG: RHS repeat-associated core domain-containing protein, partial [Planctomycetes bacterium]|nr:RHS repeat-associated core domain-containing protein [Planctomycetota bacterium]
SHDPNDPAGAVVAHYEYDPYGNVIAQTGPHAEHNHFRFSTKWFDDETGLGYWGYRYYSPSLGRWISRDPAGRRGSANLYTYVANLPLLAIDPLGLWSKDLHFGLTLLLAEDMAKISCARRIAHGANRPDEDGRDAPSCFKAAASLLALAEIQLDPDVAQAMRQQAAQLIQRAAEWHFPADSNGVVRPGSTAARAKVEEAIRRCDDWALGEGLHVLQDSWSHQGKPLWQGLGHARGARQDRYGEWHLLSGLEAALSNSADDVTIWPEDARATGMATYEYLLEFKRRCPCGCTTDSGDKSCTSSGRSYDRLVVRNLLNGMYPGQNKVH